MPIPVIQQLPVPADKFYTNPQGITDIGDPFVLKISDGRYFMYATSAPNMGYRCWQSKDMVNWEDAGLCFSYRKSPNAWGYKDYWAPEVVEYNGKFYMFYTAAFLEGLRIGVAISDNPEGPFMEAIGEPLVKDGEYAGIDANLFIDDDGKIYLYYARDCSKNIIGDKHVSQICVVELAEDLLHTVSEPVVLLTPEQNWEMASGDTIWNEGPEMIKHEGKYYLMYSANFFASPDYSVGYAVSDRPDGGFVKYENNPVLYAGALQGISGSGHHSITVSPDGEEIYTAYHTHTNVDEPSGNRQMNIASMGFLPDGTLYVNGPTLSKQPFPSYDGFKKIPFESCTVVSEQHNEVGLLNDGQFVIHGSQKDISFKATPQNGKVTIQYDLGSEQPISSVILYKSTSKQYAFESATLQINGSDPIEFPVFDSTIEKQNSILYFEKIAATKIEITLYSSNEIALSEIMLLGDLNEQISHK